MGHQDPVLASGPAHTNLLGLTTTITDYAMPPALSQWRRSQLENDTEPVFSASYSILLAQSSPLRKRYCSAPGHGATTTPDSAR